MISYDLLKLYVRNYGCWYVVCALEVKMTLMTIEVLWKLQKDVVDANFIDMNDFEFFYYMFVLNFDVQRLRVGVLH